MRASETCERWVADIAGRWGRLDILVNCAAGNFLATAEELSQNGFKTGGALARSCRGTGSNGWGSCHGTRSKGGVATAAELSQNGFKTGGPA